MARNRSRVMVGREAELSRLFDAASRARTGEVTLVLVTGEAGLGKSRLTAELADKLDDALVVVGHGVAMSAGELPFGVLSDSLRDLVRKLPPEELAGVLARGGPVLTPLGHLVPGLGEGSAGADRLAIVTAALSLFEELARDRFVCWVVEDLHWTDAPTRDVVSLLSRTPADRRLLVVATVRTDDPEIGPETSAYVDGLSRIPAADVVSLRRLDEDQVQHQLAALLDTPLPPGAAARIAELSDGIPFVIEELASAGGRPELTTTDAVASARLASLDVAALELVEAAAIGDGHLHQELVEEVLGVDARTLDRAVRDAIRSGVLEETADRTSFRFRHALLRQSVDRSIPARSRRDLHRRWAEALTSRPQLVPGDAGTVAVAHHWFHAGDAERAIRAAHEATSAAGRLGSSRDELVQWERILELWPSAGHALDGTITYDDAVFGAGFVTFMLHGDAAGWDFLQRHRSTVGDPAVASWMQLRLDSQARAKGDLIGPIDPRRHDELVTLFEQQPPSMHVADSWLVLGARLPYGDPRGEELLGRAAAVSREIGWHRGETAATGVLVFRLQLQGNPERGVEVCEEAAARAGIVQTYDTWNIDGNQIWTLCCLGRYAEVERVFQRAVARVPDARAVGSFWEHVVENVTWAWLHTGEWDRALELIRTSRPFWDAEARLADNRESWVELLRTGHLDPKWRRSLSEPLVRGGPDRVSTLILTAAAAAEAGDLDTARADYAELWERDDLPANTDQLWTAIRDASRAEVAAVVVAPADPDVRAAAERHLARIEEVAGELHLFGDLGRAWRAELAAQLERFRGGDSRPLFEQAVAAWEGIGHQHDSAVARLHLAEVCLPDDRPEAERSAGEALAVARALGAEPLRRRIEDFLRRSRLDVRAASSSGPLTNREAEVLQLLAAGRTNDQIATTLFMSPKTASVHVSRIITKLGASNRTEAAALARARGLLAESEL